MHVEIVRHQDRKASRQNAENVRASQAIDRQIDAVGITIPGGRSLRSVYPHTPPAIDNLLIIPQIGVDGPDISPRSGGDIDQRRGSKARWECVLNVPLSKLPWLSKSMACTPVMGERKPLGEEPTIAVLVVLPTLRKTAPKRPSELVAAESIAELPGSWNQIGADLEPIRRLIVGFCTGYNE